MYINLYIKYGPPVNNHRYQLIIKWGQITNFIIYIKYKDNDKSFLTYFINLYYTRADDIINLYIYVST